MVLQANNRMVAVVAADRMQLPDYSLFPRNWGLVINSAKRLVGLIALRFIRVAL